VNQKSKGCGDSAARICRKLMGGRDMDDAERWQHALFFAMSPQETDTDKNLLSGAPACT
jgi:hypothetical protein